MTLKRATASTSAGTVADRLARDDRDHGGAVHAVRARGASAATARSFNHVTLRAKRVDAALCHVQVGGPMLEPDRLGTDANRAAS